tara:strand:+ start:323 stop:682 length:360 start_codon:yes stop_codon:yes gene_type:complete
MFSDACKYFNKEGQIIKGPLVGCKIFLVFLIVVSFFNTMGASYALIKDFSSGLLVSSVFTVLLHILAILFMRYMCKRCRGVTGFVILAIPSLTILIFVSSIAIIGYISELKNKVKDEDE